MSFDVETKEVDRCPSNSQQNRVERKALHFVHVLSSSFNFIWRVIDYFSINTFSCIEIDLFIKHLITAENHMKSRLFTLVGCGSKLRQTGRE